MITADPLCVDLWPSAGQAAVPAAESPSLWGSLGPPAPRRSLHSPNSWPDSAWESRPATIHGNLQGTHCFSSFITLRRSWSLRISLRCCCHIVMWQGVVLVSERSFGASSLCLSGCYQTCSLFYREQIRYPQTSVTTWTRKENIIVNSKLCSALYYSNVRGCKRSERLSLQLWDKIWGLRL